MSLSSYHHSLFFINNTHVIPEMPANMGCSFQPAHATQFECPALSHVIELDFLL